MNPLMLHINDEIEARAIRLAERPIDFATFLDLNVDNDMELIDGVMVKKMAAQLEHELLLRWLITLIHLYVQQQKLGIVLGSRTPIEIEEHRGRLPDLLFVRQDNREIVQQRAVYGTPDMTLELISPNDRPSDIVAVETDYRKIGVPEIVFIDQQKRRVRVLHKRDGKYIEKVLTNGDLNFETIPGFTLQVEWLFTASRPDELALLNSLLSRTADRNSREEDGLGNSPR